MSEPIDIIDSKSDDHASGAISAEANTPGERWAWLDRWRGLAIGAGAGLLDLTSTLLLGIHFDMNGTDVTVAVLGIYAITFAALGFLLGLAVEARRRDRRAAAVIRAQMETVDATRSRLAQAEKLAALGQLSAAIAHEVRNALAVIRSSSQGLTETLSPDDMESREACGMIIAEIDRLTSVTSSLLAFARPLRLVPQAVEIGGLLEQAELLARRDLEAKQIRLVPRAPANLPAVRADPDLIVQVLFGLLSNAAHVVPAGGAVALLANATPQHVEIAVEDSGSGVPAELRERIFEPFFTTREKGTGLGLAVARQIVEAHGGRIEVGDGVGGGARFQIALPRADAVARGDGLTAVGAV